MSGPLDQRTLFVRPAREAAPAPRRAPAGRRVEPTSDVRRGRAVAAALGSAAALTAVAAIAAPPAGGYGASRALTPPHTRAALTCTSCHGEAGEGTAPFRAAARAACATCHGAHASTRATHARLAQRGELGCTTCHHIHAGDQGGVRFAADGQAFRYATGVEVPVDDVRHATGREVVVAAVPLAACRVCHDPSAPGDPAARCDDGTGLTACLDEHQAALPSTAPDVGLPLRGRRDRADPAGGSSGACADQHQPDRAFAHDAAREVLREMPQAAGVAAALGGAGSGPVWLGAGALGAALGWGAVAAGDALRARRRRGVVKDAPTEAVPTAPARRRLPTVDTSTCLGCYACVDACPYGVLEIERYVAVVARPDACCGLTLCEQRCPNGSLAIVEGDVEPDRLRLAPSLESEDVAGLFLAGDVTGVPLIKNAIAQGTAAADAAARSLEGGPRREDHAAVDVAIVGAGPAGLAAALRAKELGLTAAVVDQATVAHSIRSFPRDKLVFDQPLDLPVAGSLWLQESTKEELLGHWLRIARREAIDVHEHARLAGVTRRDGLFTLDLVPGDGAPTATPPRIAARRVILAIGRRGTPRRLEAPVPPELEPHVHYHLADARTFAGRRVLVVGLGDVAMEAAVALAGQPGTSVTIVHRGATYTRGQKRTIDALERLRRAGRVEILFQAGIRGFRVGGRGRPTGVAGVRLEGGDRDVSFDSAFVLVGSIPPRDLLARLGLRTTAPPPAAVPA